MRTIVCKLNVPPGAIPALDATLKAFASACNFTADWGRKNKVTAQFKLHAGCYRDIRSKFGLSANLAVRAIARVSPRLAKKKTRGSFFRPTSVDYDARIFNFNERDWMVGLTLVGGRRKFSLSIGQYQRDALAGKTPKYAMLTKREGAYYIGIVVDDGDVPLKPADKVIGVDLGLRNIATLSDGTIFCGAKMTAQRLQRAKVRRSLQTKASNGSRTTRRSVRRCIRRLRGREARFARAVNHQISKVIVANAVASGASIALEDLTGIRDRTTTNRKQRGLHNSWGFYQLRNFVSYKAARAGIEVVLVNPKYTSQDCNRCGKRGKRSGKVFACTNCGNEDADVNAARVIASRVGAASNPARRIECVSHVQVQSPPFTVG